MQNDMRELMRNGNIKNVELSKNHRANFENKLAKEVNNTPVSMLYWGKIAASILVIVGLGLGFYLKGDIDNLETVKRNKISSLGEISPAFQNIENYYLASINTEIASLDFTNNHQSLLNGYLAKNDELSREYQQLSLELESGVSEATITALIGNLQLRLKLLTQLKNHLKELKIQKNKTNETVQI
ncbi:MAG: hypothetical protein COB81_07375 [Flavobacteriaceae bacterium]|nr:MAG: hypothetical protein COB81_07375 [Flavobacteriaceae bacterium]